MIILNLLQYFSTHPKHAKAIYKVLEDGFDFYVSNYFGSMNNMVFVNHKINKFCKTIHGKVRII
jgi:hypothetical protein